jgi:hypothetical protein
MQHTDTAALQQPRPCCTRVAQLLTFCCSCCCCLCCLFVCACMQVSAWMCTVMAAAFFTANLATEKLQGSLYVNFILTSIGKAGHDHAAVLQTHAACTGLWGCTDMSSCCGMCWQASLCCTHQSHSLQKPTRTALAPPWSFSPKSHFTSLLVPLPTCFLQESCQQQLSGPLLLTLLGGGQP